MNNLQIFKKDLFEIAVKLDNGEWVFDAEKVAKSLGFTEVKNDKEYVRWRTVNGYLKFSQDVAKGDFIPESAVYKLAFKASNDVAEKFQDWLAIEVIPQIRQTGGYIPNDENDTEEDILAKAVLIAQKTIEKKNKVIAEKDKLIEQQKPKVDFVDHIATSENSLLVREVAKLISKKGILIGEKRLYQKLRDWGFVFKKSCEATQKSIEQGLMEVIEGTRESSKGTFTYKTSRVTGKGQIYIFDRLKKELKEAI